jgi:dolichol-phosphate mannosyltransferase
MHLAVAIPTYNESENLPVLVTSLFSLPLPDLSLIIVDDNSPDGTGSLADRLTAEYAGRIQVIHRAGKLGLGTAYLAAFKLALAQNFDVIGQMDADFSHPPEKLLELAAVLGDYDVAMGSRYIPGGSVDRQWAPYRKLLSAFGNQYARLILGLSMHDVTGGFRLWRRCVLEAMPLDRVRSNGYVFQVELTYLASRLGFHFKEVPIYFAERRHGLSKMSLRIQLEAALRVWRLRHMYRDIRPYQAVHS